MHSSEFDASPPVELDEGRLYALSNVYAVDGRVSWHSPERRGHSSMNCYVLLNGDDALLLDTGLSVHEGHVLRQLGELVSSTAPLTIFAMRQGEFDSVCNTVPIVKAFNVACIYGLFEGGYLWSNFRPEHPVEPGGELEQRLASIEERSAGRNDVIEIGSDPARVVEAFFPPLRLLNTYWLFDRETSTLFTSDAFSYLTRESAEGPWILTENDPDETTSDEIIHELLTTRFWWLEGARLDTIRSDMNRVFEDYDVQRIAPSYGPILEGRAVVERHVALVDQALARLGRTRIAS